MAVSSPSDSWIGASVLRKEDARHLFGHGMFIADVRMPGVQDVAFVRSDMAQRRGAPRAPAAGHRGPRLHAGRHRPAQHPGSRARARRASPQPVSGAGRRPGALCRAARRRLHAAEPRPGRGSGRPGRARTRGAAGRGRLRRGDETGQPAAVRHLAGQRLHRQHRDRRRSGIASRLRRCGCAASSA